MLLNVKKSDYLTKLKILLLHRWNTRKLFLQMVLCSSFYVCMHLGKLMLLTYSCYIFSCALTIFSWYWLMWNCWNVPRFFSFHSFIMSWLLFRWSIKVSIYFISLAFSKIYFSQSWWNKHSHRCFQNNWQTILSSLLFVAKWSALSFGPNKQS